MSFEVFIEHSRAKIRSSLNSSQFVNYPPANLSDYRNTSPTFDSVELRLERNLTTKCDHFSQVDKDNIYDCLLVGDDAEELLELADAIADGIDDTRVSVVRDLPDTTDEEHRKRKALFDRIGRDPTAHYVLVIKSNYSQIWIDRRQRLIGR